MTLDAWNRYQSVPPLVREELLTDPETLALVAEARKLYGDDLQGIVIYGKWVDGEAARSSPLELLFIMRRDRMPADLYGREREYSKRGLGWRRLGLSWHGRKTRGEVASIPEKLPPCKFWQDVANGIILEDKNGYVGNRLKHLVDPLVS